MPKMMMGQIDHARARLRQLAAEKITTPAPSAPSQKTWDDVERAIEQSSSNLLTPAVIKGGIARFREDREANKTRYRYGQKGLTAFIAEELFTKEYEAEKKVYDAEKAEWDRKAAIIEQARRKAEDIIVLGDQHAVLVALQEFAELEVE